MRNKQIISKKEFIKFYMEVLKYSKEKAEKEYYKKQYKADKISTFEEFNNKQ